MSKYETVEMDAAKARKLVEAGTGRIMQHRRDGEAHLCLVEVTKAGKKAEKAPEPQPEVEDDSGEAA